MAGIGATLAATASAEKNMAGKIVRNSATEIQIEELDSARGSVWVNSTEVDISTPITCTFGATPDNLAEGGAPAVDTEYDLVLTEAGVLAASASPPATSRIVGKIWLDDDGGGDTEVTGPENICGYGEDYIETALSSNATYNSGGSEYKTLLTLSNVVWMAETKLYIVGRTQYTWNSAFNNFLQRLSDSQGTPNIIDETYHGCAANEETFAIFNKFLDKSASGKETYFIEFYYNTGLSITYRAKLTAATGHMTYLGIRRVTL